MMYITPSLIFALIILIIIVVVPILERKGFFLNKNIANYYHKLKYITETQLNLNNSDLLQMAIYHLTTEYKSFKKATYPLEYTKDLLSNLHNEESISAWCFLFIINYYQQSPLFESEDSKKIRLSIINICNTNLKNLNYPLSFKEYFNKKESNNGKL